MFFVSQVYKELLYLPASEQQQPGGSSDVFLQLFTEVTVDSLRELFAAEDTLQDAGTDNLWSLAVVSTGPLLWMEGNVLHDSS